MHMTITAESKSHFSFRVTIYRLVFTCRSASAFCGATIINLDAKMISLNACQKREMWNIRQLIDTHKGKDGEQQLNNQFWIVWLARSECLFENQKGAFVVIYNASSFNFFGKKLFAMKLNSCADFTFAIGQIDDTKIRSLKMENCWSAWRTTAEIRDLNLNATTEYSSHRIWG